MILNQLSISLYKITLGRLKSGLFLESKLSVKLQLSSILNCY